MSVCLWGYLACVHLHQSLHNPVTQRPPLPPHIPTNIKSHRVEGHAHLSCLRAFRWVTALWPKKRVFCIHQSLYCTPTLRLRTERERGETGRDEMRYSGEQSSLFKLNQERKKREGKPVEHQEIPVEVSFIANTKKRNKRRVWTCWEAVRLKRAQDKEGERKDTCRGIAAKARLLRRRDTSETRTMLLSV